MPLLEENRCSSEKETIPGLFARAVRDYGERNLIVSDIDGSIFTYADAADVVRRIMAQLRAAGVGKGDRICIYAPMGVEACFLFWAAANLGVIFVPVDFHFSDAMLRQLLEQVKPKILFCDRKTFAGCSGMKEHVRTILFDEATGDDFNDVQMFSRWLDSGDREISVPEVVSDDAAAILYTSGSTGAPKGVILSHGALCRNSGLMTKLYGWTPDDVVLSLGELHAIGGLRAAVAALHAGYSFLITSPAQRSSVLPLVECIRKYRGTQLTTTPIVLRLLLQFRGRIHSSDLGSLRSIISAGSLLSQHLADSFYEHFHIPVLNCYGMTETAGMCISHSLDTFMQANGSIGLPVDCVAQIVDEEGNVLPDGSTGELRIRSGNLMSGYYHNAELTNKIIRDGWLYTGDLAMKRADGHIVPTGRIKNIIKQANGDFICPEEVELAVEKHLGIREAAVCGFISNRGDERLAAFIVPDAPPVHVEEFFSDLRRHIKEELGSHKVPAVIILKDALPRGATGKVLREQLKQEIGNL